jgi:histone H3/H4
MRRRETSVEWGPLREKSGCLPVRPAVVISFNSFIHSVSAFFLFVLQMTASATKPFFEKPADFKLFFEKTPPRVTAEAKNYMNTVAETLVLETIRRMRAAGIPKLLPKHVLLILTSICSEPYTYICRDSVEAVQENFRTQMTFIFTEQCATTLLQFKETQGTHRVSAGQQNRRFYKRTKERFLREFSQDSSAFQDKAIVLLAECVSKLCSIMIARSNSYMQEDKNTLTIEAFREASLQKCPSASDASAQNNVPDVALNRFLAILDRARTLIVLPKEPVPRARVGIPSK